MAKFRARQSKNVEDERSDSGGGSGSTPSSKGDRLSKNPARDAANTVLRAAYAESGQISRAQSKNAKALGLSQSLEDAQNIANKSQARLRRRMN